MIYEFRRVFQVGQVKLTVTGYHANRRTPSASRTIKRHNLVLSAVAIAATVTVCVSTYRVPGSASCAQAQDPGGCGFSTGVTHCLGHEWGDVVLRYRFRNLDSGRSGRGGLYSKRWRGGSLGHKNEFRDSPLSLCTCLQYKSGTKRS